MLLNLPGMTVTIHDMYNDKGAQHLCHKDATPTAEAGTVTLHRNWDQDVLLEVLRCSLCAPDAQAQPVQRQVNIFPTILEHF